MIRAVHANPLILDVLSRSRKGQWHTVNLGAYRGNGSCECEQFIHRLEPLLQGSQEIRAVEPGDATRCAHIAEAREYLLTELIKKLSK